MNSADKMRRLFDAAAVQTNVAPDDAVFERVQTTYTRTVEHNSAQRKPRMWRFTMKSPLARLAIAAVVVIACVIGLSLWRTTGSGIALADVLTQVEQIAAYMYQMTMTTSGQAFGGQSINLNVEATILTARDNSAKMTMNTTDPNGGTVSQEEMYLLPQEKVMIMLMHDRKEYTRMGLDETLLEETHQQNNDPGTMLKEMLSSDYESMGRSRIDGVDVEGFWTTDPSYLAGVASEVDVKIWVDVKTQLPVRSEMNMDMGGIKMHAVIHDFQWNYPVDANTFKPVIPADYTPALGGDLKLPAMNEESAIAGLKLCADMIGRYPEKLDVTAVASLISKLRDKDVPAPRLPRPPEPPKLPTSEDTTLFEKEAFDKILELPQEARDRAMEEHLKKMEEHIERSREQSRKWEEDFKKWQEQSRKLQEQFKDRDELLKEIKKEATEVMNKLMPIQSTVVFYRMLMWEKKAPAYYGNVVTPQDADKVLMRWKLSDNQYRVIFGSLHAETVDAATLAELEKDLPKK